MFGTYVGIGHVDYMPKEIGWHIMKTVQEILNLWRIRFFVARNFEPFLLYHIEAWILE